MSLYRLAITTIKILVNPYLCILQWKALLATITTNIIVCVTVPNQHQNQLNVATVEWRRSICSKKMLCICLMTKLFKKKVKYVLYKMKCKCLDKLWLKWNKKLVRILINNNNTSMIQLKITLTQNCSNLCIQIPTST